MIIARMKREDHKDTAILSQETKEIEQKKKSETRKTRTGRGGRRSRRFNGTLGKKSTNLPSATTKTKTKRTNG